MKKLCIFCSSTTKTPSINHEKFLTSLSESVCELFGVGKLFSPIFQNSPQCPNCFQLVLNADYALKSIKIFQHQLETLSKVLKSGYVENYSKSKNNANIIGLAGEKLAEILIKSSTHVKSVFSVNRKTSQSQLIDSNKLATPPKFSRSGRRIKNKYENKDGNNGDVCEDIEIKPDPDFDLNFTNLNENNAQLIVNDLENSSSKLIDETESETESALGLDQEKDDENDPDFQLEENLLLPDSNNSNLKRSKKGKNKWKKHLKYCCNMTENCRNKGKIYNSVRYLKKHLFKSHKGEGVEKPYHCSACDEKFINSPRLTKHELIAHSIKLFQCEFCDRGFSQRYILKDHIELQHAEKVEAEATISIPNQCFETSNLTQTADFYPLNNNNTTDAQNMFKNESITFVKNSSKFRRVDPLNKIETAHELLAEPKYCCNITPQCASNGKIYKSVRLLKSHLKRVHCGSGVESPYHCSLCEGRFDSFAKLERHEGNTHGAKRSVCEKCGKRFTTHYHLKLHIERLHTRKDWPKCSICFKIYETNVEVATHEILHAPNIASLSSAFDCVICSNSSFSSAFDLQRHVLLSHEENTFKCTQCPEVFLTKSVLDSHKAIHLERKLECPFCTTKFLNPSSLKLHLLSHAPPALPCPFLNCTLKFRTKSKVNFHVAKIHGVRERTLKCQLCPRMFLRRAELKAHQYHHSDTRAFKCDQCPSAFKSSSNLRAHLKVHEGKDGGYNVTVPKYRKGRIINDVSDTIRSIEKNVEEVGSNNIILFPTDDVIRTSVGKE